MALTALFSLYYSIDLAKRPGKVPIVNYCLPTKISLTYLLKFQSVIRGNWNIFYTYIQCMSHNIHKLNVAGAVQDEFGKNHRRTTHTSPTSETNAVLIPIVEIRIWDVLYSNIILVYTLCK